MSSKLNRNGMQELIDGDLAWLEQQPRTLEREHTALIVKDFMKKYHDGPQYDVSQMRVRIAELVDERDKYKAALEKIAAKEDPCCCFDEWFEYEDALKIARETLKSVE